MMPVHFTIDAESRLVAYTVIGRATAGDAQAFMAGVLSHPDFQSGFNFLGDRRDETATPDTSYVQEASRLVEENRRSLYPCRWAILVSSPVAYGMARMWGLMVGGSGVEIMPFYELEGAAEWLGVEESVLARELGKL